VNTTDKVGHPDALAIAPVDRSTGRPFQQNHCGSVLQHLTLDLPDASSDIWFVSAASSAHQVAGCLPMSANSHSPVFLTTPEFSSCPFPVYTHRQCIGDLLILPPSW